MARVKESTGILKALLIISLLANAAAGFGLATVYVQTISLKEQSQNLSNEVATLKQQLDVSQNQLSYYKNQADYFSRLLTSKTATDSVAGAKTVKIVAVRSAGSFGEKFQGIVMSAEVELRRGEGRILINTQPKIGIDLQTSARTAAIVAENITGVPLQKTDIILTIRGREEVEVVDGPSAGATLTSALISVIRNEEVKPNVYATGTINPDGTIGLVGGILEKAVAAAELGGALFLVPKGQSIVSILKPEEYHPVPGVTILLYKTHQVKLQEYLEQQGFKLRVAEVKTIRDLYEAYRG